MDQQRHGTPQRQGYQQNRYGNIPNKFSVINPNENAVYNEYVAKAGLQIALGANVCFYVNKLNHAQFEQFVESIPDKETNTNLKNKLDQKMRNNAAINWISTLSFTPQGKYPCASLKDSMAIYSSFDIEAEAKRISSYGMAKVTFDFSQLPLLKADDGAPFYPYGIFFFSDMHNEYDDYQAVISCLGNRRRDVTKCTYLKPIDFAHEGPVTCTGKFRNKGSFVIFFVANEIEKQEGVFYPDVTIIDIPVAVFREPSATIKTTGICNIQKGSNCVTDFVNHVVKDLFSYYGVRDQFYMGEIVHAFGYNPLDYNFPPSSGDDKSRYYGENHAHFGQNREGKYNKYDKPFNYRNNLFNYLNEVNAKRDDTLVSEQDAPVDEVPPPVKTPPPHQNSKKNNKGKGGNRKPKNDAIPPAIAQELEEAHIAVPEGDLESHSPQEIDAALNTTEAELPVDDKPEVNENAAIDEVVADTEGTDEGDSAYEAPEATEEAPEGEIQETHHDEESPQGINIDEQEVSDDANNQTQE
jgi:hypothetical protein